MDTQDKGLEGAVRAIQEMSMAAVAVGEFTIDLQGKDKTVEVPVSAVVVRNGTGQQVMSLLDLRKAADGYARELRLRDAAGPDRREGTAQLQALDSLIAHANRFKGGESAIWADAAARKIVTVLDYHEPGHDAAARWSRHRGVYECPLSEAWIAWGGGKEVAADQETFAHFLDSHDRDLASGSLPNGRPAPEPAVLITLANNLETFAEYKGKRTKDANTGRMKLAFSDETGFLGDVMPPHSFLISVPVFQDGAPQPLEVRLTAAVAKDGSVAFSYRIHAAGDILRDAFQRLCNRVESETGLPLFLGRPEQ